MFFPGYSGGPTVSREMVLADRQTPRPLAIAHKSRISIMFKNHSKLQTANNLTTYGCIRDYTGTGIIVELLHKLSSIKLYSCHRYLCMRLNYLHHRIVDACSTVEFMSIYAY